MPDIEYDENGKIERRFTPEWKESGDLKIDELLPKLATVVITQVSVMVSYIEKLHDEIDRLKEKVDE